MDWTKETTQLLGRFQPWHRGHTELLKRGLAKTGQVVILLREQDGTEKNPYNFEERYTLIMNSLKDENIDVSKIEIIRVPNITHITYGRDVGYKIEQEVLGEEIEAISATQIRNRQSDKKST